MDAVWFKCIQEINLFIDLEEIAFAVVRAFKNKVKENK